MEKTMKIHSLNKIHDEHCEHCIMILIALVFIFNAQVLFAGGQSSTDYFIEADVISCGGDLTASSSYYNTSTIGQSGTIGTRTSAQYDIGDGFWLPVNSVQPTPTPSCIHHGDVNFSGSLTAGDAQLAFQIVLAFYIPTYEEECAADCDANGSVTAGDAQGIFLAVLSMGTCTDPL